MNVKRMRRGLRIIYEECPCDCRDCVFADECMTFPGKPIGEIAEDMLDYCIGGRFYTPKEEWKNDDSKS